MYVVACVTCCDTCVVAVVLVLLCVLCVCYGLICVCVVGSPGIDVFHCEWRIEENAKNTRLDGPEMKDEKRKEKRRCEEKRKETGEK